LAPKGVLLYGAPGTGKTLLARAVPPKAACIHSPDGPEIMRKFYGESEAKLREVFEEAARHAPAILFIDEIDAVAPKRAEVTGEVEKRVVAQLLSLMDGFVARGHVIVIGATNIPEMLDPALRRPGRFDSRNRIGVPNTQARLQILRIHTRAMPLAPDVDLQEIAELSHGFVGADLRRSGKRSDDCAARIPGGLPLGIDGAASARTWVVAGDPREFPCRLEGCGTERDREFFIEKSETTFCIARRLDEVKRMLDAVVEHSHLHAEIYEKFGLAPPRGILLVGPSERERRRWRGRSPAKKQLPLIAIDGPQLYSKWLGIRRGRCASFQKGETRGTVHSVLRFD